MGGPSEFGRFSSEFGHRLQSDTMCIAAFFVTLNDMDVGIESSIKIVHLQDFLLAEMW